MYSPLSKYGDLSKILSQCKSLTLSQAWAISFQLCSGLGVFHSSNMMHRDIKPNNILIDEQTLTLKICDFGQVRVTPSVLKQKCPRYTIDVGSRWYKAPELLFGGRKTEECSCWYDHKIDIWSLGCIISELIQCALISMNLQKVSNPGPLFQGISVIDQIMQIS